MKTKKTDKQVVVVLCRWTIHAIGEPRRYCAKPLKKPSATVIYCDQHQARLPFWPA